MVFVDPPLGHIQYPMEKVSANALSYPERLRIVIFVTQLLFPMRHPFDGFKLVPAHHAILGVVAIGPYAALYPSARMLQMGKMIHRILCVVYRQGLPMSDRVFGWTRTVEARRRKDEHQPPQKAQNLRMKRSWHTQTGP